MRYTPQIVTKPMGINAELTKIALAINDTLSRVPDTPNFMDTDLDMNSNRILNLPVPSTPNEPVRLQDLIDGVQVTVNADNFVQSLKELPTTGLITGTVYSVTSFFSSGVEGSGFFVWDAGVNKVLHNGGTIISPEAIAVWDGTVGGINTLLNWIGTGTGCWVLFAGEEIYPNIVLRVPSQYASINAAVQSIAKYSILNTVTISVADGTYNFGTTQVINHVYGNKIRVIGNQANKANVVITCSNPATYDLIAVTNGYELGFLDGFTLTAPVKMEAANNFTGILADNHASLICGANIAVNNLYYGIAARDGSFVLCDYAVVTNSGDVGIWAYTDSTVSANYAQSTNAVDTPNSLGFGFQAEFGSTLVCTGASASGCLVAGIAALSNGIVRAHSSISSNNTGSGFFSLSGGTIENHMATANSNTRYGQERVGDGTINGNGVTLTSNTLGANSSYASLDNGSLGARVVGTGGDLRVDVSGAYNIYFNSSGGVQAQVTHTASSNSWPAFRASSSNQPGIEAAGAAAAIDYNVKAKTTGRVFLASQRANYLAVQGSDSGSPPAFVPEGVDANIDYYAAPKGTTGRYLLKRDNIPDYADDTAAAAGGLGVGKLYRTGSTLKVRIT